MNDFALRYTPTTAYVRDHGYYGRLPFFTSLQHPQLLIMFASAELEGTTIYYPCIDIAVLDSTCA